MRNGFAGFLEMLRATLRHAGGVRIDHVMGLAQTLGRATRHGGHRGRLSPLSPRRYAAAWSGSSSGAIGPSSSARISAHCLTAFTNGFATPGSPACVSCGSNAMAMRFREPQHWSPDAVAMTSTHDLPTVAGWWRGRDLEWRSKLGMKTHDEDHIRQR